MIETRERGLVDSVIDGVWARYRDDATPATVETTSFGRREPRDPRVQEFVLSLSVGDLWLLHSLGDLAPDFWCRNILEGRGSVCAA